MVHVNAALNATAMTPAEAYFFALLLTRHLVRFGEQLGALHVLVNSPTTTPAQWQRGIYTYVNYLPQKT